MKIFRLFGVIALICLTFACNPFNKDFPVYGTPEPGSKCGRSLSKNSSTRSLASLKNQEGVIEASAVGDGECGNENLLYASEKKTLVGKLCNVDINVLLTETENFELIKNLETFDKDQTDVFAVLCAFLKNRSK